MGFLGYEADLLVLSNEHLAVVELIATCHTSHHEAPRIYVDLKKLLVAVGGRRHLVPFEHTIWCKMVENYIMDRLIMVKADQHECGFSMSLNCEPGMILQSLPDGFIPFSVESIQIQRNNSQDSSNATIQLPAVIQKHFSQKLNDENDRPKFKNEASKTRAWRKIFALGSSVWDLFERLLNVEESSDRDHREGGDDLVNYFRTSRENKKKENGSSMNFSSFGALRVSFRPERVNGTPHEDATEQCMCPFAHLRDTRRVKLLFHGVGTCTLGAVDVLLLRHRQSRMFEITVFSIDQQQVWARLCIEYDELMRVVDQAQIQRTFYSATSGTQVGMSGGSGNGNALRDATLRVMTEYLLSHLVVYQAQNADSITVQILADREDGDGGGFFVKVLDEPLPESSVRSVSQL